MASTVLGTAAPAATHRGWNTLKLLRALRHASLGSLLLLLLAIATATGMHRGALKTIGKDAAPSMVAAQHIKAALADMDAEAANDLLTAVPSTAGEAAYDARRTEATEALLTAAENITYGESERVPIQTLEVELGSYERALQRARDLQAKGKAASVDAYRQAASVMDSKLLPAADALDAANSTVLERVYRAQAGRSAGARAFVLFAGLLALSVLSGTQLFLAGRTRRVFNPFLLIATALTIAAMVHGWRALEAEQEQIKIAKEDAFSSIHALWQARALAYEANSDESRFLLDPAHASGYERAFLVRSHALATIPAGLTSDQLLAAARNDDHVAGFSGYLADELRNLTFPGERDAALLTLTDFEDYLRIDTSLRELARAGQHREAVALCVGTRPGQSDWAFAQFDGALGTTLSINQSQFELAVARGFGSLANLEGVTFLLLLLAGGFLVAGFASRLREYQ